jgi:transposase
MTGKLCVLSNMKRNDPTFRAMVSRLLAGEITRSQAASEYGIQYNTLCVWLTRSKIDLPETKKTRSLKPFSADTVRHGAAVNFPTITEERAQKMNLAVQKALSGEMSARAASIELGVSVQTVSRKVRSMRVAQGLPVRPFVPRGHPYA